MSGRGRPLRFLAAVAVGWIGARALFLWPQGPSLSAAAEGVASRASAAGSSPVTRLPGAPVVPTQPVVRFAGASAPEPPQFSVSMPLSPPVQSSPWGPVHSVVAPRPLPMAPPHDPPLAPRSVVLEHLPAADRSRWSASGWLVARSGSSVAAVPGAGQLGGSQAGVRGAFLLDANRRIILYGRVAAPLAGPGREAAAGVEWQPSAYPVRLSAEQRFGMDGTRGGPAAGVVWGVDVELPGGYRLESYAQAGAVARARIEPYADGAARLTRTLARPAGLPLSVGGGIWGGAQRGATRFDIGPSATLAVPIGEAKVRVALDWRQRIAGDAAPGSGLALTLGADF